MAATRARPGKVGGVAVFSTCGRASAHRRYPDAPTATMGRSDYTTEETESGSVELAEYDGRVTGGVDR